MANHIENRATVVNYLKEELVGPCPRGEAIDCSGEIRFDDPRQSYGPWTQRGSGEEILHRDRKVKTSISVPTDPVFSIYIDIIYPPDKSIKSQM